MTKLYVMGGKEEHQSFDLQGETFYIGRAPENDIQIEDKYISRKHLKLQRKGNKYVIQDLNTKNGTFVNGTKVQSAELNNEDTVQIGNVINIKVFTFSLKKKASAVTENHEDKSVVLSTIERTLAKL